MIGAVIIGAVLAAVLVGAALGAKRPPGVRRILRWSATVVTVAVAVLLTPATVSDAGAAALFLLGVPVVAAALPMVAYLTDHESTVFDAVGGAVMAAWAVLLGLGIGLAFLPGALLLLTAAATGFAARASRSA